MVNTRIRRVGTFFGLGVLSLLSFVSLSQSANAFVVEQSSQGAELHWEQTPSFAINSAGSADLSGSEFPAVQAGFQQWVNVSGVSFSVNDAGTTTLGYSDVLCGSPPSPCNDGTNTVVWTESGWQGGVSAIGLTYTIFYVESGEIIEADVTLNGEDYTWTTGDTGVQTDVMNIATHEIGHFIGFGHSSDPNASMYASAAAGETKKRDLNSDDEAGMQYLYGDGSGGGGGGSGEQGCCGGAAMILSPLLLLGLMVGPRRKKWAKVIKTAAIVGVTAFGALVISSHAFAATLEALPIESLADHAEFIVTGKVTKVEATRIPDAGIVTFIEVEVAESLKGDAPETLVFVEPGGEPEGSAIGMKVSGTPTYTEGEEVLVFLHEGRGHDGFLRTVALVQGKFRLERTNDGRVFAVRDIAGIQFMRINADGAMEVVPSWDPSVPEALELDTLESLIEKALE